SNERENGLIFYVLQTETNLWKKYPSRNCAPITFREDFVSEMGQRRRIAKDLLHGENLEKTVYVPLNNVQIADINCDAIRCDCGAAVKLKEQEITTQRLSQELEEAKTRNHDRLKKLDNASHELRNTHHDVRVLRQKDKRNEEKKRKCEEDKKSSKVVRIENQAPFLDTSNCHIAFLNDLMERTRCSGNSPFSYMLKEFSFELHYTSPRAYKFVRSYLPCLPHPRIFC
ncbi:unnamed protein product, partial [Orchesella dallaii]